MSGCDLTQIQSRDFSAATNRSSSRKVYDLEHAFQKLAEALPGGNVPHALEAKPGTQSRRGVA